MIGCAMVSTAFQAIWVAFSASVWVDRLPARTVPYGFWTTAVGAERYEIPYAGITGGLGAWQQV